MISDRSRQVFHDSEEAGAATAADRIPERDAIDSADRWDVEALYADAPAWETDFGRIEEHVAPLEALKGQVNSAETVAEVFRCDVELDRLVHKLYVYAQLRADENTANNDSQARRTRLQARMAKISGRLAWILPEILSHPEDELREWAGSDVLEPYRYRMERVLRQKPHTLSESEETLLSKAGRVFAAPRQTFSFLTDADIEFPEVSDEKGQSRELSQGRYITFLLSPDRRVRREAFEAMWDTFGKFRNTLACTLSSNIQLHNYLSEVRHFPSALEASLHSDQIPVEVYDGLIAATHDAFEPFYEYVGLRRERLGLDDLGMHDLYVSIVPDVEIKVPFEEARRWIEEACEPLGDEYGRVLRQAFDQRWIDRYENRGKRSGAYSSGCYDSLPYILMNYQGTLDSVFTLAHELGHSMHSWFARATQPPQTADYPIFIAEIPSTLNEGLLLRYLLEKRQDPPFRAYLLNHLCDSFKGTVFRQTMFAEFEKMVHEMDARGEALTPDVLCDSYFEINSRYYGPDIDYDRRIGLEWSRIPHFYYNFYVYKYATSFCASRALLAGVLQGAEGCGRFLDLLRAGGSDDPLPLIRLAGVDLARRDPLDRAFQDFAVAVGDLRAALDELGSGRTGS